MANGSCDLFVVAALFREVRSARQNANHRNIWRYHSPSGQLIIIVASPPTREHGSGQSHPDYGPLYFRQLRGANRWRSGQSVYGPKVSC